jgi:hypothetical protein
MRRMLTWASSLDRAALAADGHRLVEFTAVRREVESRTRRAQQRRTSLANPAEEWLSGVAAAGKLAILGVRLTSLDDLRVLHGYVLEPALRSATAVAVECEQRLTRLPPVQFVDPEFGYPYTLERALDAAMRLFRDRGERLPEPRAVEAAAAPDESALDAWQRSAVAAREGVVQVIAPAGSGNTAVLIERVRELGGRGVPEERILCMTFTASLAAVSADARIPFRLEGAGRILDALTAIPDALRFVSYLRRAGGLDEHFAAYEAAFGDTEKVELETLEQAQKEASGKTVLEYAQLLAGRRDALRAVRDDAGGIELTTIHRAKGRQWPEVHLFACEEQQLPHRRALEVDAQQRAAGEGLEAERRLAYVAFTRARERLSLHTTDSAPSRFLTEAGLAPARPYRDPAPKPGSKPDERRPFRHQGDRANWSSISVQSVRIYRLGGLDRWRHGRSRGSPGEAGRSDVLVGRWWRRAVSAGGGTGDEGAIGARRCLHGVFEQAV